MFISKQIFPALYSPSVDTTDNTKTKRKHVNSDFAASKRCRSNSGSIEDREQTDAAPKEKAKGKKKVKQTSKKIHKIPMPPHDGPAMGTRSKKKYPF